MSRVRFRFRQATGAGDKPVEGYVACSPTARVTQADGGILLPMAFMATLPADGADLMLELEPTGADWCWRIREYTAGYTHTRHVAVPESVQTLDYATLSEVDWAPAADSGHMAHSIRTYAGSMPDSRSILISDLKPADGAIVGDSVVDATGRVWLISAISDGMLTVADSGVRLSGERGPGLLTGLGAPTAATEGMVGDSYCDLATGEVYKLTL